MVEMKDSGIEWVGEIPKNWAIIHNKYIMYKRKEIITNYNSEDILSLTMKGVIKRDLNEGGKMPSSFDGYQKINKGNLLLCLFDIDVTPRCVGIIKDDGITSPAYSQFVIRSSNDVRYYYYYYLMTDNGKALVHLSKSLRHSLNEDQFGNINTIKPPLSEQQAIADFLDHKCADIDKLSGQIQKEIDSLQEYRKRVVTKAVTRGLNENVPMKDSGVEWIGNIPNSWKIGKIKYFVKVNSYKASLADMHGNYIGLENVEKSTGKYVVSNTNYEDGVYDFCKKGDVLYGKLRPNLAKVVIAPFDACCSGEFQVLTSSYFDNKWLLYYLLSDDVVKMATAATYGTKMPRVNWNFMANLAITIPSREELGIILNYLDQKTSQIDKIISEKQKQLSLLSDYRNSLIFQYVTGKKQVPIKEGE